MEVDHLLRERVGSHAARAFLGALLIGAHTLTSLPLGLVRRAVELDATFADLDLGFVDGAVMALAESLRLPILTFDFEHFRATRPARGFWRLVIDERGYAEAAGG